MEIDPEDTSHYLIVTEMFCYIHSEPEEAPGMKNHSGLAIFTNTVHLNAVIFLAFIKRPFLPGVCTTT